MALPTILTKDQQTAIVDVRMQLGQPAPMKAQVTDDAWVKAWNDFFDWQGIPATQRVIVPQPKIVQTFAGDFTINVIRGWYTHPTTGKRFWLW